MFALATVIAILWPRAKVLAYTVAAWIAASRVLLGEHYLTDVVFGAILGTAVPYYVRDRFAARRWLFERTPQGGYRIRGARTQRWLGWPPPESPFRETRLFGNSGRNSQTMGGE
jgi:undecaprenyl-diphosphatase